MDDGAVRGKRGSSSYPNDRKGQGVNEGKNSPADSVKFDKEGAEEPDSDYAVQDVDDRDDQHEKVEAVLVGLHDLPGR